jgi:2-dehydro-3-deoxygluconokinase
MVVTLGEAMLRLSPPRGELLADADLFQVTVGGAESNVAVALASLGVPAAWIGGLPAQGLGARVAGELRACGVDTSRIVWRDEGRVGLYVVEAGVPPRPAAVLYDRAGSAATTLAPADLEGRLDGATHAVVSGVTAALEPHGAALVGRFLQLAGARGARRYLDVNHRARLWPADRAGPVLRGLAAQAEVVVCSAADARTVLGVDASDGELPAALALEVAPQAELVVVTLGDRGAAAWSAMHGAVEVGGHAVEVVDGLGAGDALLAGLVWAEIEGRPPADAVAAGVALAALACTVRGDHARFAPADVERLLRHDTAKAAR